MKIMKIINENKSLTDKVLQYYTNLQILELLKQFIDESEYLIFIRHSVNDTTQSNLEDHLIHNVSKSKLLDLIKSFNNEIYDMIIELMINTVY